MAEVKNKRHWEHKRVAVNQTFEVLLPPSTTVTYKNTNGYGQSIMTKGDFLRTFRPKEDCKCEDCKSAYHGITFGSQWIDKVRGTKHTVMAVIVRAGKSDEIRYSDNDGTPTVCEDSAEYFLNKFRPANTKSSDTSKHYKCEDCKNAYHANTINGQIIKEFGICNRCELLRPVRNNSIENLTKEVEVMKEVHATEKEMTTSEIINEVNSQPVKYGYKGARYFYVTFSYSVGGKRSYKKGRICLETENGEMFNASKLENTIRVRLKKKSKAVIIDNWIELNHADYETLNGGSDE